jgi:tetratricopeptide (TPR) repeat protein
VLSTRSCPDAPVYFVNASAEDTLKVDFENIIRSRGTEYRTASHEDALTWLATKQEDWLVIMDNADDPSLRLLPYISQSSRGHVIITTRNANQAMLSPNSSHHLEGLSMEDAISLIITASGYEDTDANRALAWAIVEVLGRLPLALAQAAGYLFVHKCLSTYLILFQRSAENLLETRPSELPYNYPFSVAATIQMSLDRLPTHALNILRLFSHLDSTSISHAIIDRAADRKFRRVEWAEECDLSMQTREQAEVLVDIFCVDGKWSEVEFNNLIMCCLQYSLLRATTQGAAKFYSMHILVQSYIRAKVDLVQGHRPGPLVVRLLGSSSTYSNDYKYLAFNRLLLPHLRQIQMEDVVEAGDHLSFGEVMRRAGDNKSAVPHLERCVDMYRGSLSEGHNSTLWAMVQLANSYSESGRAQKALKLEEKVLDARKTILGADHRETLVAEANLASSYFNLGRNKEAAELIERVLESQKEVLGPEDADTVSTMDNLAVSYTEVGRNREAMELHEQVLEIRRRTLEPADPYTLRTMANLAESYRIVGRKREALELNRQALEMQKRVLGDEHPDALNSIRNRLHILHDLGMTEQLRALLRVALPAHEKMLGMDHPDLLWIRKSFGTELALL